MFHTPSIRKTEIQAHVMGIPLIIWKTKGEKEKELEEVFKQWVALSKENNSGNGFNTFKAEMGVEMPYYFWTETGKSAADYYTEGERESKQMGEQKVADLWGKTIALFKKFETKTGMPRPDLSVMPKK